MKLNLKKVQQNLPTVGVGGISLLLLAAVLLFPLAGDAPQTAEWASYASVNDICELATLRSYYHNVVVHEEKPEGAAKVISDILTWPFDRLLKTGYKQFWLEYSGIVEVGINLKADTILIGSPDASGIIDVYLPEPRVLRVDADESSFSAPLDETGLFTAITARERAEAYAAAQEKMRQEAEQDQSLLRRAKNNAKILLEHYLVTLGKEMGAAYTVRWVDNPW